MFERALPRPLSQKGYLGFRLTVPGPLRNGIHAETSDYILARLPGLALCRLTSQPSMINLSFEWEEGQGATRYDRGFLVDLTDLPGPRDYFLQFTWDASEGYSDGYLNGIPLRICGTRFKPWQIIGAADRLMTLSAPLSVSDGDVQWRYIAPEEILALVPPALRQRDGALIGTVTTPEATPSHVVTERLIYFDPLTDNSGLNSWVMEGPGEISVSSDGLVMRTASKHDDKGPGHFVYWCSVVLPESFIAQWDFRPISETGLAIVFFSAHGPDGTDIFDPKLLRRNGVFSQYTQGDLHSYHLTYFANLPLFQTGRPTSNLRKNSGFYLVAQGPVAIRPGTKHFQTLRLMRNGPHIRFYSGDQIVLNWCDRDAARFGPPCRAGRLGFRQMEGTIGAYRNLRIWTSPGTTG
jgi:hypothetical protein